MRSLRFTLANRSMARLAMKALFSTPLAPDMGGELKALISGIDRANSGEMVLALDPLSTTNSPEAFFPTSVRNRRKCPTVKACVNVSACAGGPSLARSGIGSRRSLRRRQVQRDQVLREDVHANNSVHFSNFSRRGLNKAIMKFKIANHNLIDPRFVTNGGSRFSYAFKRLLGKFPHANLFCQLARDGDAGRPGIDQQRHRGAADSAARASHSRAAPCWGSNGQRIRSAISVRSTSQDSIQVLRPASDFTKSLYSRSCRSSSGSLWNSARWRSSAATFSG